VKAVEEAISRSWIQVARQTCPVHLKRSRRVRDALDSSPCPTRGSSLLSYFLAPRELWPLLRSNNTTSPSTPSRRVRQVPLPLEDRPGYSPQTASPPVISFLQYYKSPYFFMKWSNIFSNSSIE